MPLRKANFNDEANINATCLNELQSSFDSFIASHQHDGVEAPLIDSKEVSVKGYDTNSANQTLYQHARDYSTHTSSNPEAISGFRSNRLNEADYVQINLINDCSNWTFNGLYWETYVALEEAYSEDYTVELQPVYDGSYSDFFTSLNEGANFANLDGVVPLNNSLLNINLIPCNLTDKGFSVRLYAIGKGTRHQLVAYDESSFSNKNVVYVPEDISVPIAGNLSFGSYKLPYKGGFNYLPKKGKISMPVEIMLNVTAQVSPSSRKLIVGESVQALPFNAGSSTFYAFSENKISGSSSSSLKDFGYISNEDILNIDKIDINNLTNLQQRNVLISGTHKEIRKRSFHVINSAGHKVGIPLGELVRQNQTSNHYVVVSETITIKDQNKNFEPIERKNLYRLSDVQIIDDNIIMVAAGFGNLVPRAIDPYGNIEETNIVFSGDYEVLDDEYILIKNATFNGKSYSELYYEPIDVDTVVAEGDVIDLSERNPYILNYDPFKSLVDVLPYLPNPTTLSEVIEYKGYGPEVISRYPGLEEKFSSLFYAKKARRLEGSCRSIKIRPNHFVINAYTKIGTDSLAFLSVAENIILRKSDLIAQYQGTENRVVLDPGIKRNINKADVFKPLNKMSYMIPEWKTHFYTYLKWAKTDGTFRTAFAEVFNNNIINYITSEDLLFEENRLLDRYQVLSEFAAELRNYVSISGRLKSYLKQNKRVYYIETKEKPTSALVAGSRIKLSNLDTSPINYLKHPYTGADFSAVFENVMTPFDNLFEDIGVVKSVVKQSDDSYRIYLYSPSDGWDSNTTYLDKILNENVVPADVVNIGGEPTFLYKTPKSPLILRRVNCLNASGGNLVNLTDTIKTNEFREAPFSFNLDAEDSAAATINHYMYFGLDVPFNYIKFMAEDVLTSTLLSSNITYEYLDESRTWREVTVLSAANHSNANLDYSPNLISKDAEGIISVVFTRPTLTGSTKWASTSIPEISSQNKFWIRMKAPVKDYDTLSFKTRKDYYPSFRSVAVGSIAPNDIVLDAVSGILMFSSPDFAISIYGMEDVDWESVRPGDFVSWTEWHGANRCGIIKFADSSPNENIYIYLEENPYTFEGTVTNLHIRPNPLGYIKNINFTTDNHVNNRRRTNNYNPIAPSSTAGFFNSVAYADKKQQFMYFSEDVEPDQSETQIMIRNCFDEYIDSQYVNLDVDKFYFDADFIATDVVPIIQSSELDDVVNAGDSINIKQRLWVNKFETGADELWYFVTRPVDDDRYYLAIFSNNPIPAEEHIKNWGVGVFGDRQGFIWNDNYPVISRDSLTSGVPSASASSLEYQQNIQRYFEGKIDTFGGKDVIAFTFSTNDIFESYDPVRPSFDGITWVNDGTLHPYDNVPVDTTITFGQANGYYTLVVPINITSFGDIFKNKNDDFYFSDPRTILTKEYGLNEEPYRFNLLDYIGTSSFTSVEDVEKADNFNFNIIMDSSDYLTKLPYVQKILSDTYLSTSLYIDEADNDLYVKAYVINNRTHDSLESEYLSGNYGRLIQSEKTFDIGRAITAGTSENFEVPIRYNIAETGSSLSYGFDLVTTLGDGVYCFSTPLANIKHYSVALDGAHFGVDVQLQDSYISVDDIFRADTADPPTFETVEGAYEIASRYHPLDRGESLIWTPAKWGNETGIHICNWGYNGPTETSEYTVGIDKKFVAAGQDTDSPDANVFFENCRIKSIESLKRFLQGSQLYIRAYRQSFLDAGGSTLDSYNDVYLERFAGIVKEFNFVEKDGKAIKLSQNEDGDVAGEFYLTFADEGALFSRVMSHCLRETNVSNGITDYTWTKTRASALKTTAIPSTLATPVDFTDLLSDKTKSGTIFYTLTEGDAIGANGYEDMMPLFYPYSYAGVPEAAPTNGQTVSHHVMFRLIFRKAKDGLHDALAILHDSGRDYIANPGELASGTVLDYAGPLGVQGSHNRVDSSNLPMSFGGSANLLTIVKKKADKLEIVKNLIQADGIDSYRARLLSYVLGNGYLDYDAGNLGLGGIHSGSVAGLNKSLAKEYEILVGDESYELSGVAIDRSITINSGTTPNVVSSLANFVKIHPGIAILSSSVTVYSEIDETNVHGYVSKMFVDSSGNYRIELSNGKILDAGTYKTAFWYPPLKTKVPEDYTRHTFYLSDLDGKTLYTNNLTFDYENRKVLQSNHDKFFARGDMSIEKNIEVPFEGYTNRTKDIVHLTVNVPDYHTLEATDELNASVLMSAIYSGNGVSSHVISGSEARDIIYKGFLLRDGDVSVLTIEKNTLVGDGQNYFISIGAGIFRIYDPSTAKLGAGRPNFANIIANNAATILPYNQYAYELTQARLYKFAQTPGRTVSLNTGNKQFSDIIDYTPSDIRWVGNLADKAFFLTSKGTKGYDRPNELTFNGSGLYNRGLHNGTSGLVKITSEQSNFTSYDFQHPMFSKFFTPYCTFYAPLADPDQFGSLRIPHYKFNEKDHSVNLVVKSGVEQEEEGVVLHRMKTLSEFDSTIGYVFLNKDCFKNSKYYELEGLIEVENIFEHIDSIVTDDNERDIIRKKISDLLSQNPIAQGMITVSSASISSSAEILSISLGSEGRSVISYLGNLQARYGLNLAPYLSVMGYSYDSVQDWALYSSVYDKINPPRKDGKMTELQMVDYDVDTLIRERNVSSSKIIGHKLAGEYVKILYGLENADWSVSSNKIVGCQIGPPSMATSYSSEWATNFLQAEDYDNLFGENRWWSTQIDIPNFYRADTTRSFTIDDITNWKEDPEGYNMAINVGESLFGDGVYENIRIKELIDLETVTQESGYQWVFIGNINITIYEEAPQPVEFDIISATTNTDTITTIFSANDWNKLTRKFDIVLDDDYISTTRTTTAPGVGADDLLPYNPVLYTSKTAYAALTEGKEPLDGEVVYEKKFAAFLGAGRRIYYNSSWGTYENWDDAGQSYATSSFSRAMADIDTYRHTPIGPSSQYYHTLITGSEGAFYGFQPRCVSLGKDNDGIEKLAGWYYFSVPRLPDYMRLPMWALGENEGIQLECFTSEGWVRCPIEKTYAPINIKMLHPDLTDTDSSPSPDGKVYQDVKYTEVLPMIPENIVMSGPGSSMNPTLPPDFGHVQHNCLFYPTKLADLDMLALIGNYITVDDTTVGSYSSMAIVDSKPSIAYYHADKSIKFVISTDINGIEWNIPVTISSVGTVSDYQVSLSIIDSNPAVSYSDANALYYVRASNTSGSAWGAPINVDSVGNESVLLTVDGNPAIAYYDETNTQLKFIRSDSTTGATWATPAVVVDTTGSVGRYLSMAIVDGYPAISYYDATNGNLNYVRATDADGTAWSAPVVLDSTGNVGLHTSLLVVNGKPAISYYDATNANLKFISASNAQGTVWAMPVTLDSAGSVGLYTSLKIVNGAPAISYYDATNTSLKFIRARNASGSMWNRPITIDDGGSVGSFTGLLIVNSTPAVVYSDATDTSLNYVRALDSDGTIWGPIPTWGASVLDWHIRPIAGYHFRVLTNIEGLTNETNVGNIGDADSRNNIIRLVHTTPPQFVNIVKSDCWIEDIRMEGKDLHVVIAGNVTEDGVTKTAVEVHSIEVNS